MVWLSHVWVQLDQGGMHQPRKNGCAVLGQGLNLSLSYFGGKFTSDCIQSLLSVNYEPKYHIEVMAQRGQNYAPYFIPDLEAEHLSIST